MSTLVDGRERWEEVKGRIYVPMAEMCEVDRHNKVLNKQLSTIKK